MLGDMLFYKWPEDTLQDPNQNYKALKVSLQRMFKI